MSISSIKSFFKEFIKPQSFTRIHPLHQPITQKVSQFQKRVTFPTQGMVFSPLRSNFSQKVSNSFSVNIQKRYLSSFNPTRHTLFHKLDGVGMEGVTLDCGSFSIRKDEKLLATITFSDALRKEIQNELAACKISPYTSFDEVKSIAKDVLIKHFPSELKEIIQQQAKTHYPAGLLLKNCPRTENPPPTPIQDRHLPEKGFIEECLIAGLIGIRNAEIYHEKYEKFGEIFSQVIPIDGFEDKQTSRGSRTAFDTHTEQVHLNPGIDFLYLSCIRGDPNATTKLLTVDSLLEGIPESIIDSMLKPIFRMHPGQLWEGDKTPLTAPILEVNPIGGYFMRFNSELGKRIEPMNEEAKQVIEFLKEHVKKPLKKLSITLEQGDCLIFSNRTAGHGRDPFKPAQEPGDRRWLVRAYEREITPTHYKIAERRIVNNMKIQGRLATLNRK